MLNHKNLIISLLIPLFIGCGGGSSSETTTTISDTQISNSNIGSLSLAICEEKYGHYTNQQWAEAGYLEDGDEKNQINTCFFVLVGNPQYGQDPQFYIDSYNRGDYIDTISSEPRVIIDYSQLDADEIGDQVDRFEEYSNQLKMNTIESCKEKYGYLSFQELSIYANEPTDIDIDVGQPINGDAAYCHVLLQDSGYYYIKK